MRRAARGRARWAGKGPSQAGQAAEARLQACSASGAANSVHAGSTGGRVALLLRSKHARASTQAACPPITHLPCAAWKRSTARSSTYSAACACVPSAANACPSAWLRTLPWWMTPLLLWLPCPVLLLGSALNSAARERYLRQGAQDGSWVQGCPRGAGRQARQARHASRLCACRRVAAHLAQRAT